MRRMSGKKFNREMIYWDGVSNLECSSLSGRRFGLIFCANTLTTFRFLPQKSRAKERVFSLRNVIGTVSPCILSKVSLSCGNAFDFQRGTLLMNRFQFFGISLF